MADYALRGERAWAALTNPVSGAVTDTIAPGPHAVRDYNYGTFLLADAQLRAARRTGDSALADTAVAVVTGLINRNGGRPPADPFNQFAAAAILSDGRAGRLPESAFARIEVPLERMIARFAPFTGHGFADPAVYDNWRLVWAAAAIRIVASGLVGEPGSIAEHPARLRAEVARIVSELVPANAGPLVRTPYGPGRVLSDPGGQPNAYHVFSVLLLEHIFEADPGVFSAAALSVREEAGRYALALMAPDGQLTHSGRSMEQSWVLAAAADLGAMRAAHGGPDAAAWRAFADRALNRLVRVHGTFADGTTPVVPGLRQRPRSEHRRPLLVDEPIQRPLAVSDRARRRALAGHRRRRAPAARRWGSLRISPPAARGWSGVTPGTCGGRSRAGGRRATTAATRRES